MEKKKNTKEEQVLVVIKPDAAMKGLSGTIIDEVARIGLRMIGVKLVKVNRKLIEKHYEVHKDRPFYNKLVDHMAGVGYVDEILAFVYSGENAISRMRDLAGKTHPEDAAPNTLRGRYGRVHTKTDVFENVVHVSDAPETAEKEIKLWFSPSELIEAIYQTKKVKEEKLVWA